MTLFKIIIGEDDVYYDRKNNLPENECEVKYIVAETYENAEQIVQKYMHDNYDNAEYELSEFDTGEEGILLIGNEELEIDSDYTL